MFEINLVLNCRLLDTCLHVLFENKVSIFRNIRRLSSLPALIRGRNTLNNSRQMRIYHICNEKELMMLFGFTVLRKIFSKDLNEIENLGGNR